MGEPQVQFKDPIAFLIHSKWNYNKVSLDLEFTIGNRYINSSATIPRKELIEKGTYGNEKFYENIIGCLKNIVEKLKKFKSYREIDNLIYFMWMRFLLGLYKYELRQEKPEGQSSLQVKA